MRARSADKLLLPLLVVAVAARAAGAQEAETTKQEEESSADTGGVINSIDASAWQTLESELFVSGERGIADPGSLEPIPREVFRLGHVSILPKWDEDVIYDDNVFLTDTDAEKDFIVRSRFGALADWHFGSTGSRLVGGYDMYRNYFVQGESKHFVEQLASAQLDLDFNKLRFTVGDRWEDRTDPILAVFTAKIQRNINTIYGTGGWYEETTYLEVKAQDVATDYDSATYDSIDRTEGLAHAEFGWRTQDETWLFVRAGGINRVYDQSFLSDMVGGTASIGIRSQRAPEFDLAARIGVRYEQFDDGVTDRDDEAIHPEFEGRALWWPIRTDGIDARYVHTTEFSPVSNYQTLDRVEVGWTHLLTGRVRSRAGFGFEFVDPSAVQDEFVRYVVGAGLAWRAAEFVDVTMDWRVRIRATDVPNGDYVGNQVSIGIAVRL
jgi:hypothetical protein